MNDSRPSRLEVSTPTTPSSTAPTASPSAAPSAAEPVLTAPPPPGRPLLRFAAWTAAATALVAGTPVWLFSLRDQRLLQELDLLHVGWLGFSAICLGVWLLLATTPPTAIKVSQRVGKRLILLFSAVLALSALAWLVPLLSPEPLRYRFDGKIWLLGESPYTTTPAEIAARGEGTRDPELRADPLDLAAPHADRTTLNGPTSQAGFVAARTMEYLLPPGPSVESQRLTAYGPLHWRQWMLAAPWWRQMWVWRCLMAGLYLLTIGELIAWLRQRDQSAWWSVLFAWQPLVLVESVGMAHQEMLGVLFLVAGLRRADIGRFRRAAICLAASVAVKPLALLALPFVIRLAWQGRAAVREPDPTLRINEQATGAASARRALGWFLLTLVLLLTPLWIDGGWAQLWSAFQQFAATAREDGSIYRLLERTFAGEGSSEERVARVRLAAWLLCGGGVAITGTIAWLRRATPAGAAYAMMVTGLLFSPVAPPWTVIWLLALVPVLGGRAGLTALVWAGTATLYYNPTTLAGQTTPNAAALWEYVPVYLAALIEIGATLRRSRSR